MKKAVHIMIESKVLKVIKALLATVGCLSLLVAGKLLASLTSEEIMLYISYFAGFSIAWILVYIVFFDPDRDTNDEEGNKKEE